MSPPRSVDVSRCSILSTVLLFFSLPKTEESEAKYPTVSLCKFHGFKCAKRASNCNQSSWTTLQDIRANSYLLEDFYESATLSEGYTQTVGRARHKKRNLIAPFVSVLL